MADITDVALNVGGWVVGGVTALGGILVAHYFQEKGRLKQEDRVGVFEPLRREMTGILENGDWRKTSGYSVWSRSEAFSDLLKRGALKPRRLNLLREDVSRLLALDDVHEKARVRFYNVRHEETGKVWDSTRVTGSEFSPSLRLSEGPQQVTDDQLQGALARGDKEAWVRRFNEAVHSMARGGTVEASAPGERLYDELDVLVKPSRDEFASSAKALIGQADLILKRLDAALAGKLTYKVT